MVSGLFNQLFLLNNLYTLNRKLSTLVRTGSKGCCPRFVTVQAGEQISAFPAFLCAKFNMPLSYH